MMDSAYWIVEGSNEWNKDLAFCVVLALDEIIAERSARLRRGSALSRPTFAKTP